MRDHEQTHLRIGQLALRSELQRRSATRTVSSVTDVQQLLKDALARSNPIARYVNAKFDVRTDHGFNLRPEARWHRERRLTRAIRYAERLRARNPSRFERQLKRLEARSADLLQTQRTHIHSISNPTATQTLP